MGSSWKDRESAAEGLYFNRADAEALAKLAAKMEAHHATPSAAKISKEKAKIAALLEKHGVEITDGMLDDVSFHPTAPS